jgi:hypothetical protein
VNAGSEWLFAWSTRHRDSPLSVRSTKPASIPPSGFTQCHFFAGPGRMAAPVSTRRLGDDRPVLSGSCPCQPFSSAGAGLGFADERHLWPCSAWLVGGCRPRVILGEQVAARASTLGSTLFKLTWKRWVTPSVCPAPVCGRRCSAHPRPRVFHGPRRPRAITRTEATARTCH